MFSVSIPELILFFSCNSYNQSWYFYFMAVTPLPAIFKMNHEQLKDLIFHFKKIKFQITFCNFKEYQSVIIEIFDNRIIFFMLFSHFSLLENFLESEFC